MKNNLSRILDEKSVSITDLAKMTGIGRTTLSTLSNSSNIPDKTKIGTLLSISKALNVTLDELITNEITGEYYKWYPLVSEPEHDTGIISIITKSETMTYLSLFFAITDRSIDMSAEIDMDNKMDKLYSEFTKRLNKQGETLVNENEEFYSNFEEVLSKHPQDQLDFTQREDKLRSYYFENNPTHVNKIRLSILSKGDFEKLSRKRNTIYSEIIDDDIEISFSRIAKDLNDSSFSKISKQINNDLIKSKLNSPETGMFIWELGLDVYSAYRVVKLLKNNGNFVNAPQSIYRSVQQSMLSRLLDY